MSLIDEIAWLDRRVKPRGGHDRRAAYIHTHSGDFARWEVRRARARIKPRLQIIEVSGRYLALAHRRDETQRRAHEMVTRVREQLHAERSGEGGADA